jgi:hypothetical protein
MSAPSVTSAASLVLGAQDSLCMSGVPNTAAA